MIKKFYAWLYKATARADEKGEYSGGRIQGAVRQAVLGLCIASAGKALEIGTGSGLFLLKLASQNPDLKIWSVDTDEGFLDEVAKKIKRNGLNNIHLLRQDARSLSFDRDTFDTVICINFFIDANEDLIVGVLEEMKRVSKPSGRIIFEFRNSRNIFFRLKYKFAKYYDDTAPSVLYTYKPEQFDAILKKLDLEIVNKKYIGFPIDRYAPIIIVEARKR